MTIETGIGTANVLHRLALGVECVDALTEELITSAVRAGREVPTPPRTAGRVAPRRPCVDLERAGGGRFRLRHGRTVPTRFVLRVDDATQRVVPRRLAVQLHTAAEVDEARVYVPVASRVLRPWLFPGPNHEPGGGTTAIRGRVVRGGVGVRWARVVATTTTIPPVVAGRAHADDRGEFLLVVTDVDQDVVESVVTVDLVASARDPRRPVPVDPDDRCADLVVEQVPRLPVPPPPDPGTDLLRGVGLPAGYVQSLAAPLRRDLAVGAVTALTENVEFVALP